MTQNLNSSLWNDISRLWHLIDSPLRPSLEDVEIVLDTVRKVADPSKHAQPFRTLLLGVTPEIATLNWPEETKLTAVDRAPGMISGVWPGNTNFRSVVCADWLKLPFGKNSFDFVVGDGCLVLLDYPEGYRHLARAVRGVMTDKGCLMLRIFCRPEQTETLDDVMRALQRRDVGGFDAFKWRLLMAIQGQDVRHGVRLADAWEGWHEIAPDPSAFAAEYGWPLAKVSVIDAYRNNPARYHFPSMDEVVAALGDELKQVVSIHGTYELSERCPHVLFKPLKEAL